MGDANLRTGVAAIVVVGCLAAPKLAAAESAAVLRGESVFFAGGCLACHTDIKANGPRLAGGPPLKTPFGTFYAPNITPDPDFGIGRWSDEDFIRAMRAGVSPDGRHYYPAFPYPAYTKATVKDLLDLKAYLFAQPPVAKASRAHELWFPFTIRSAVAAWKWLNFAPGEFVPDPSKSDAWNRGAYLVVALGHCAECHTSRNILGGLDHSRQFAGSRDGPPGETAPNITPHAESGIGGWKENDIVYALELGFTPDGEALGGSMGLVVRYSTSKLTVADRRAIATYLKGLPPLPSAVKR